MDREELLTRFEQQFNEFFFTVQTGMNFGARSYHAILEDIKNSANELQQAFTSHKN